MSVYEINKGINRSITYKGVKAQYISYLAIGMLLLMVLFGLLYAIGFSIYVCIVIVIPCGAVLISVVQRVSKTYGEHGLLKKGAQKRLPHAVVSHSRAVFHQLLNP